MVRLFGIVAATVLLQLTAYAQETDSVIIAVEESITDSTQKDTVLLVEKDLLNTQLVETDSIVVSSKKDTVAIIGVGDIMLGTGYPKQPNYLPPNNDCSPIMRDVLPILQNADVTFGNLEGALIDDFSQAKVCNDPKTCYTFGMPTKYAQCLVDAGFDLLSIANNHSGDFDYAGRVSTKNTLNEYNLAFAGTNDCKTAIIKRDSITYGFCAFAPNWGTVDIKDISQAKQIVAGLDSICDIVIVSFHGGAEGSTHQHVTRNEEEFLGHNRGNVYKFSHAVIDAGADVVFGHGPHVTRAVELYKNRIICYSLGNFATYRRFNISGPNGVAPIVKVFASNSGEFLYAEVTSIYQIDGVATRIDKQERAFGYLKSLTALDFPEMDSVLKFENGKIIRK